MALKQNLIQSVIQKVKNVFNDQQGWFRGGQFTPVQQIKDVQAKSKQAPLTTFGPLVVPQGFSKGFGQGFTNWSTYGLVQPKPQINPNEQYGAKVGNVLGSVAGFVNPLNPLNKGMAALNIGGKVVGAVAPKLATRTTGKIIGGIGSELAQTAAYTAAQAGTQKLGLRPKEEITPATFGKNLLLGTAFRGVFNQAPAVVSKLYAGQKAQEYSPDMKGLFGNLTDKKIRFEISDEMAKSRIPKTMKRLENQGDVYRLGEILAHPKFYNNYPEMANTPVVLKNLGNARAQWDGQVLAIDRTFALSPGRFDDFKIQLPDGKMIEGNFKNGMKSKDKLTSVILHEIQHAIQQKEGFARGGSPDIAPDYLNPLRLKIRQAKVELNKLMATPEWQSFVKVGEDAYDSSKNAQEYNIKLQEIEKNAPPIVGKIRKLMDDVSQNEKSLVNFADKGRFGIYEGLAGEVESRDVQARIKLTPEQRLRTMPYSSQGIPVKDQIVRFDDGVSQSTKGVGGGVKNVEYNSKTNNLIEDYARSEDQIKKLQYKQGFIDAMENPKEFERLSKEIEQYEIGNRSTVRQLAQHHNISEYDAIDALSTYIDAGARRGGRTVKDFYDYLPNDPIPKGVGGEGVKPNLSARDIKKEYDLAEKEFVMLTGEKPRKIQDLTEFVVNKKIPEGYGPNPKTWWMNKQEVSPSKGVETTKIKVKPRPTIQTSMAQAEVQAMKPEPPPVSVIGTSGGASGMTPPSVPGSKPPGKVVKVAPPIVTEKYTNSVNLNRLKLKPEEKKTLVTISKNAKQELEKAKGQVLSNKEVINAAKKSQVLQTVVTREQTEAAEAALLRARQQVVSLDKEVTQLAKEGNTPALQKKMAELLDSLKVVNSNAADRGRQLQALSINAGDEPIRVQILKDISKVEEDSAKIIREAANVDWNNANKVAEFYRKFIKPSATELIDEFRYNNMLSSPRTHIRNTFSNLIQTFVTRPATLAAQGKFGDTQKYYQGAIKSLPNAVDDFVKAFKGEIPIAQQDIKNIPTTKLPKFLTIPSKLLEASDRFFTKLITGGEIARGSTLKQAEDIASYSLFRQGLRPEGQGKLLNAIDSVTAWTYNAPKAVRWFVPFIRTPMNFAKQWIEYSPLGLATLPGAANKKEQIAKAFLGSTIATIGAKFALDNNTTWAAPTDPKEKEIFYASGRKPFSIKIGDKWVSMMYAGPFAQALALPAAVKYYQEDNRTALTDSQTEKLSKIAMSMAEYLSGQTFLEGMNNFVKFFSGDADYSMGKNLGYTAGQLIPMQGLVRWVNSILDPVYRKTPGFTSQIQSGIPGLSQKLEPYKTPEGELSTRESINAITPYDITTDKPEYQPKLEERQNKLQQNAIINQKTKEMQTQLDSGVTPTPFQSGNIYLIPEDNSVRKIEITEIPKPDTTDKKAVSSYNSKVSNQIKKIEAITAAGLSTPISVPELTATKIEAPKTTKLKVSKAKKPKALKVKKLKVPKLKKVKVTKVKTKKLKFKIPKKTKIKKLAIKKSGRFKI